MFVMNTPSDGRQHAPATQRNREAILEVLLQVLPSTGTVLEIASGTGEHSVFFAPRLQALNWQPSDPNPLALTSIAAWGEHSPSDNLYPPVELNVQDSVWAVEKNNSAIAAIVNINMIHISPWTACLGLMAGSSRILPTGGILYLYGPFKQNGQHTAPSNAAFDESLKMQNSEWGVRDIEEVIAVASKHNLNFLNTYQMPANNLSVVFEKA
jgi:Protein of unknown function (DUF938)